MYLSASGRRTGHISLWPLLQALHIHAIHHTSQAWLCLQLQNKTFTLCHPLIFVYLIHIHTANMDFSSPTHTFHPSCQKQTVHWWCFVKWERCLTCPCLGGARSRGLWGGKREAWQGPGVCPPRGVPPPPPYMEPCCLDWQFILLE